MWAGTHLDGIPVIRTTDLDPQLPPGFGVGGSRAQVTVARQGESQLQRNFPFTAETPLFGRQREIGMLNDWWDADALHPVMVLTGISGIGKTALAWYWAETASRAHPDALFIWWQLHPRDGTVRGLLQTIVQHFEESQCSSLSTRELVERALFHMRRHQVTLVVDEGEPALRHMCSAMDGAASSLFHSLADPDHSNTKLLLTSRWLPENHTLRKDTSLPVLRLGAISPVDAFHYLNYLGLRLPMSRLVPLGERLRFHPYSLRLLAGTVLATQGMENLAASITFGGKLLDLHNILPWAVALLPESTQLLLRTMASQRERIKHDPVYGWDAAQAVDTDLERLVRRGLVTPARDRRQTYYVVPHAVQLFSLSPDLSQQLVPEGSHSEAAAFQRRRMDLARVVGEYDRIVGKGKFDEALSYFRRFLVGRLDAESGKQSQAAALVERLLRKPGIASPRVSRVEDQVWVLSFLAERYAILGRTSLAAEFYRESIALYESSGEPEAQARDMRRLANVYLQLGALKESFSAARRSVMMARRCRDLAGEADARLQLGFTLAICGHWAHAVRQVSTSLTIASEVAHVQLQSRVWAYTGWLALLQGDGQAGLESAEEALRFTRELGATLSMLSPVYIRLHWLHGWAYTLMEEFRLAELHLNEAVRRARKTENMAWMPAIHVARARLFRRKWLADPSTGLNESAREIANEALLLSLQSGQRLVTADAHLLLAELGSDRRDMDLAHDHAGKAMRCSLECSEPFAYTAGLARARALDAAQSHDAGPHRSSVMDACLT